MRSETVLLVEDDNRIIKELKAARDVLAAAIECLERLDAGRGRKRGRPPAWLNERGEGNHPGNADAPERACEKRAYCATRNTRKPCRQGRCEVCDHDPANVAQIVPARAKGHAGARATLSQE
jgi:hypothetical protein